MTEEDSAQQHITSATNSGSAEENPKEEESFVIIKDQTATTPVRDEPKPAAAENMEIENSHVEPEDVQKVL